MNAPRVSCVPCLAKARRAKPDSATGWYTLGSTTTKASACAKRSRVLHGTAFRQFLVEKAFM
ncbi:hypothetical protein LWC08_00700 [Desulfobaculum bizertense]|uniref:hypothetical protein n=1 Tax=Desulfobaculum bizertense TaxID=376490 RepID=UPI001F47F92F|nr:hypothetical protein [Desulfobaculum bizertense]UIJ38114.1 hypothetical protein LWC08_00700 [Desulfobaculum bizertense]